jgi:ABC-type polysaccharide/polyol phosphate export permease
MFVLMPLACIYYPVTVLPHWLRYVAWTLPPTYVFEGMRSLLIDHEFRADLMIAALAINCRAAGGLVCRLSRPAAQRPPERIADPKRRIATYPTLSGDIR